MENIAGLLLQQGINVKQQLMPDLTELEYVPPTELAEPVEVQIEPEPNLAKADPDSSPLSAYDDRKGVYLLKDLAAEYELTPTGLRKSRYAYLIKAIGGDAIASRRLRPGRFTELAAHLFRLFADRPKGMTPDDWAIETAQRFADEDLAQAEAQRESDLIADAELLSVDAELVPDDEFCSDAIAFREKALESTELAVSASQGRSHALLLRMQSLVRTGIEYGEMTSAEERKAAESIGYERRMEVLLAMKKGELQADKDLRALETSMPQQSPSEG